jgi:hypothetical protein
MSAPLVPSPLDYVGHRRFSLYPAVTNAEPNEWVLGTGSWSDVQVVNSHTGGQMWIPRQYIGGVSDRYDSVLVVELTKELEYKAGAVEPRVKRVIEMPQATGEERPKLFEEAARPIVGRASVVAIRTENREHSPMNRALVVRLGAGALALYLLAVLMSALARS